MCGKEQKDNHWNRCRYHSVIDYWFNLFLNEQIIYCNF